MISLLESY